MRTDVTMEQVHAALRAWTYGGDPGARAAVDMLIEEEWWLRRLWAGGLIDYSDDPDIVGPDGEPIAVLDWVAASKKRWPQSGGELALLMAACSIGSGSVKVNFRDLFTSMDSHNSMLVINALKAIKRL
ncbi:hypothetical protein E6R60_26855 [Streptomyces sp. A0642]|uniref:hypothetical protein n=1 Tax=Streptomyces sp. A0642 TaxID=2563100 RepID=UPI0010A20219|nr:hypothetical protein [Streptomyces sp. A0642]THA72551.1 hypothetical protein E6R60_26855 [Streptomyces sp. A0642]